jgi:hypothetical protein
LEAVAGSGLFALGEENAEADIGIDSVERQLSTRCRPHTPQSGGKLGDLPLYQR